MVALTEAPVSLPALGASGSFTAQRRAPVNDVTGHPVAELSLVPPLFVSRTMAALRNAPTVPPDQRLGLLDRAADLFAGAVLCGQSRAAYELAVSRVGGVPRPSVEATVSAIADRLRQIGQSVQNARPRATGLAAEAGLRSGAAWTRRGNVLAVHAAGNHPGPHSLWPEALALGYRVAVRPSQREPFTPARLVAALRQAGFAADQVAYLPTDHTGAEILQREADLGLVYGGHDVVARFAGNPRVLTQGPGRSKILITADRDWRRHLDTVVDSVSGHGGTGCVNATAVFVEGDPAPLCAALTERLAALPSLPPDHERACLPVWPALSAKALAAFLTTQAAGTRPWLGAERVVDELGDASAVLRPAIHQLADAHAAQAGLELPFPCVWVAPWSRTDGIAPLRHTLVLTAITGDGGLVERLVDEPSISNIHLGDQPTHRIVPGLPHDGFLAEFLMRSKAVVVD
jgi:acyl-CoA reductase-like NAD-dependent aldehyde dehydrogenase